MTMCLPKGCAIILLESELEQPITRGMREKEVVSR
jgi:hypothetical protein